MSAGSISKHQRAFLFRFMHSKMNIQARTFGYKYPF